MPTPRRLVAALVVAGLVLAGCGDGDDPLAQDGTTTTDGGGPTTTGPGGFTPEPMRWDDCGAVQCGTLEVPLDYADPTGPTIDVYAVRTEATGDRYGALFVNPGGPGASAAEMAEVLPIILPPEIAEHYDIVGIDPRGVGGSSPIDCGIPAVELYGVDATMEDDADEEHLLEVSQAYVDDCDEEYGEVLAHVGTNDVARDMDAMRAAMGDETLSYLGFSYGTAIGQAYADLFPDRIDKMILDGVLELGPSGLDLAADQAAGFELALSRFAESCGSGCETSPDPIAAVEEVLALAEEGDGIPAPDADRPAGPGEANLGISYALYSQQLWSQLDDALADALDGDGSGLVALADGYIGIGDFEVYFAVNCLDFAWPTGDPDAFFEAGKTTAETSPHFGEALVLDYIRCVDWPVAPVPLTPVTAPGAPPILVISTTGDPATPYDAGVAVAERLESGVLVTNDGEGHTVVADGKPCIDELVVAYLVDDVVPENGTTCED